MPDVFTVFLNKDDDDDDDDVLISLSSPPLPNQIHNKNFQTNTEDTYKN